MLILRALTFGDIKRGRQFYRLAKHYRNPDTHYLLRYKTGPRSARFVSNGTWDESKQWRPSRRVYVLESV